MLHKINTIIFDCFGVVCEPVLHGWYRDNRINKGFSDTNLKNVFEKFDLGQISEEDIVDYFLKYKGIHSTKEELREQIDSYLKLDFELVKNIKELKDKGFKIALLSNCNASFFERKVYSVFPGFKELFDEIILSSEIKMIKPNKDIYEYTLKKINSEPCESLFVDDSQINVDGAIALGINGFVYTDVFSFKEYLRKLQV